MTRPRVLVVDDREENVYLLRALLEGSGFEVIGAANGAEALESAHSAPPELIITDILMPVMDGFALCRACKQDERLRSVPLIFYTATYTDERDREFALSLGADRFVVKPMEPDALVQIVREVLDETPAGVPLATDAEPTAEDTAADETGYLKHYNETLVRKLEAKMEQLAESNRRLEEDVVARRAAEAEARELNETLEARVRERTAQLEMANMELESFSYSVSHDLRAPLRAIDGFVAILLEDYADGLDDEGRRICGVIRRNARHMGDLIDDLLAFSRLGRAPIERVSVDMRALAAAAFAEVIATNGGTEPDFRLHDLPVVWGDSSLLLQVWTNVLGNAVKFSAREERPVIEVSADTVEGEIRYVVRDNGAGFDPSMAESIFDAFVRGHPADQFEGTGVGLAMVRRIVERHGGRVWASGVSGAGATIVIALPSGECVTSVTAR